MMLHFSFRVCFFIPLHSKNNEENVKVFIKDLKFNLD